MDCKKGIELYGKARRLIPGGTQLLSKRPEMFLPGQWPSYYERCSGAEVRDLDGNRFLDMSITGVGTCVLGYADPDVDAAVRRAIEKGSMCTLNCPEEVELAELLIELHPWAEMVRYTRSGGEVMAVAVRIARAATGKDLVAFCGYHGWHDWYLAANLADDRNLDGQLLPGLEPAGVPRPLEGTALPFKYNSREEFDALIEKHGDDIAAVVMEPVRHKEPEEGFLEHIRDVTGRRGIVLVFDEITSGWRMNVGGIHLFYGVSPDMATFAKGLGNGYPMGAVIGRREVMDAAQRSFISSTCWTERVGPERDVPEHLIRMGNLVRRAWEETAGACGLKIKTQGIPPLRFLALDYGDQSQPLITLFTQEMLNRGFLAGKAFYACYAHSEAHVDEYRRALKEVFGILKKAVEEGDAGRYLKGPAAHAGFKRLT
jgi:glutamate-1-semialdehyde aminotransferase